MMEGDTFLGNNGSQSSSVDGRVGQAFQQSFGQVQNILDQNRLLINEINQNHQSKIPHNISRNVGLIRDLNNNIKRVVDLYADLSTSFSNSCSEGESSAAGALRSASGTTHKRNRPG